MAEPKPIQRKTVLAMPPPRSWLPASQDFSVVNGLGDVNAPPVAAPPPPPDPMLALRKADRIYASPSDQLNADLTADEAGEYRVGESASHPTVMRAPTRTEQVQDWMRNLYEGVAAQPIARVSDALGLTGFSDIAHGYSDARKAAEPKMGMPPPAGPEAKGLKVLSEAEEIKALFPRLDNYGKPSGRLTGERILKRLQTAEVSPAVRKTLTKVAKQVGERRIAADELHALAKGEAYTPERVLRKVAEIPEGKKQIPGAPLGVSGPRQEKALREGYLRGVERGVEGRDWYEDTGKSILFHANDDPARARLVAGDIAITSPATSVGANTGMGVKAYNQMTAGVDVNAGRFPTAMGKSVRALHEGGEGSLGLKRDPFAENIALGGGFEETPLEDGVTLLTPKKTRAVHDIWDAEMHGYVNPDGSPMRTGFGPAQHRFMDRQQDKIVATANQRAIGGFTDWNDLRTQASGWTGAKIKAGDIDPNDAAKSVADYLPDLYAQGHREFPAGPSTGHMSEMLDPNNPDAGWLRQLYHDTKMHYGKVYDPQMRDQIAANYGGLVGQSFEGPGYYKGQFSPGHHTQVLTGSMDAPGGLPGERVLDEGSRRIMDATEATYGLLNFQDAYAWSKNLPAGSGGARTSWDIRLPGGKIDARQMQQLVEALRGTGLVPVPLPGGVRLGIPGAEPSGQQAFKFMQDMGPQVKAAVKGIGGTLDEGGAGAFRSGYGENPWQQSRVGQEFFDPIRKLPGATEKFDDFAPDMMARNRIIDRIFAKNVRGRVTLNPLMDEIQGAVANEGWGGLERLAKKHGIPVLALLAAVGLAPEEVGTPPPAPPSS